MGLFQMTAVDMAAAIRAGEITAEELVQDCLARISTLEDSIGAWAYLDPGYALSQAQAADSARRAGESLGPLHGVPVGVKDIFDTHDMPTEHGTALHAGRAPSYDATVVELLREAGAVIMGKTITTELAVYAPGKTTNPHDPQRTPGGSSSGSAAAVAAAMVPLTVGTQTNGSIIRPASYCGVYGYKPSHGLISRYRVLQQSRILDHVGVFGRTLGDVALIAEQLMAFDDRDPDMRPRARPRLIETTAQEPPSPPRLAMIKTAVWDHAEAYVHGAFEELAEHFGNSIEVMELPEAFQDAVMWHRTIMEADLALSFERDYQQGKEQLSDTLCEMIERGLGYSAVEYNRAVAQISAMNKVLDEILLHYDAIITPATTGEAPLGLESTGSPIFCTLWTLCGVPAITAPVMQGSNGMPVGVQLVASRGDDARLLRTARWFATAASAE